jgi:hypothetical protein
LTANQPVRALDAFAKAREFYKNPADILRVAIHEALRLRALNRTGDALSFIDRQLKLYDREPAAEVLRMLQREMAPGPAASPAATTAPNAASRQ